MGQLLELEVERLAAGGLGLARLEGRIVFLPGVLPGELVSVEVLETRSDYLRARPVEVLRAHPDRVEPACPLFMVCGGCQLLHAAYGVQPGLKAGAALEGLVREGGPAVSVKPSPRDRHYRARVRFQIGEVAGRLRLGFYSAGSNSLIPVDFCLQLDERLNRILPALGGWIGSMSGLESQPGQLEALAGPEGYIFVLDLSRKPGRRFAEIIAAGPDLKERSVVRYSVKGRLQGGTGSGDDGLTWLTLDDPPVSLKVLPGSFAQVNPGLNLVLVGDVLDAVRELAPASLLDLYCGMGNFSLPLSHAAGRVTAVEDNPAAEANGRFNQKINGVRNIGFIRQAAGKAVEEAAVRGEKFDVVVMDPPRAGARGMAMQLARLQAREVFYISCHPAAMARDLVEFGSLGYRLRSLTAYDMFPQTAHLEVLARLGLG